MGRIDEGDCWGGTARRAARALAGLLVLGAGACGGRSQPEGVYVGECCDGADNDGDGKFDAGDPDCADAPACPDEEADSGAEPAPGDRDGDGVPDDEDCAPGNPDAYPGNTEQPYDGVNNDCDPATPDDDLDGDGVAGAVDCDDGDPVVGTAAAAACWPLGSAWRSIRGDSRGMKLGSGVALAGDRAGDGRTALLVGARGADNDVGAVYLFEGSTLAEAAGDLGPADAQVVWTGRARYDLLGDRGTLATVPDIDGDGVSELFLRNPGADPGGNTNAGEVYLLLSDDPAAMAGGVATTVASVRLQGAGAGDFFGSAHAIADLDGDGTADLGLGAAKADVGYANAGALVLFDGSGLAPGAVSADDAELWVHGWFNELMGSGGLQLVGDLDGDGAPELALGSTLGDAETELDVGVVYVLPGDLLAPGRRPDGPTWVGELALFRIEGDSFAGELGAAIVGLDDRDGDGRDELAVGMPMADLGTTNAGAVCVFDGVDSPGAVLVPAGAEVCFPGDVGLSGTGDRLDGADLDGDGAPDLLVGLPYAGAGARVVGLSHASAGDWTGSLSADATWLSTSPLGDAHGSAVAAGALAAGDAAGLAVGAPEADGPGGDVSGRRSIWRP